MILIHIVLFPQQEYFIHFTAYLDSNEDIFNHGDQSDGEQFSEPESLPDLESDSSDDSDGHIDDELFRSRDDSSGMSDDGVHFSGTFP